MTEVDLKGISQYYTTMPGGNKSSSSGPNSNFEKMTHQDLANLTPIDKHMGQDPFGFSSLTYPLDLTNPGGGANGHYMVFYVNVRNKTKYIYNTPSGGFAGTIPAPKERSDLYNKRTEIVPKGTAGQIISGLTFGLVSDTKEKTVYDLDNSAVAGEARYKDFESSSSLSDSKGASLSSGAARTATGGMDSYLKTTTRISTSIALYLPPNVQDSLAAAYNGLATGMVGLGVKSAVKGGVAFQQDDMETTAGNLLDAGAGIGSKLAARGLADVADALGGGEGAEELINKSFGAANNPFMEVLFDQMSLRQFTYNFVFAPKSQEETDEVQKIIKLFRFHMAPELQGGEGRFLTLPSTFDIHYLYQSGSVAKENDYYNKIATCVLENVSIDYTPGGVKSFADGAPTQITMGLTFKETELLTKDKIDEGF
jgi:hypothetical protein|tara:strand:- start:2120 stop:3394 length:1275 start_codon:yes stop_codon:yes gene_type:complete